MLYSAYFVERAKHYRKLAEMAPNGRQAERQLGLANLFLEMACDTRLRERADDVVACRQARAGDARGDHRGVAQDRGPRAQRAYGGSGETG